MERDNLSKYNIIASRDGEYIIGYYDAIVDYYKAVAKDYIDTLDMSDYDSVNDIIELLKYLGEHYDKGILCEDDLLKVGYNPMGAYTYTKLVEDYNE